MVNSKSSSNNSKSSSNSNRMIRILILMEIFSNRNSNFHKKMMKTQSSLISFNNQLTVRTCLASDLTQRESVLPEEDP